MESAHNSQGSVEPPSTTDPVTPAREREFSPGITLDGDSIWQAFGVDQSSNNGEDDEDDNTQANDTTGVLGTPVQSSTPIRRGNQRLFPRDTSPSRDELFTRPRSPARSPNLAPTNRFLAWEHDATINARAANPTNTEEPVYNPSSISLDVPLSESGIRSLTLSNAGQLLVDFRSAHALVGIQANRIRHLTADTSALRERIAEDDARFLELEAAHRTLEGRTDGYSERLRRYEETEGRSEGLIATMELEIEALNGRLDETFRGRDTERRAKDAMTVRFQDELQRGEQAAQRETAAADALRIALADTAHVMQQLTHTRAIVTQRDATIMALRLDLAAAIARNDNLQLDLTTARDDIGTLSGTNIGTGTGRARGVIATLQGNRPATASLGDQLQDLEANLQDDHDDEEEENRHEDNEDSNEDNGSDDIDWPITNPRIFRFVRNIIRNWPVETFINDWAQEFPELLVRGTTLETEVGVEETDGTTQTDPPLTLGGGLLRGGWMNVDDDGTHEGSPPPPSPQVHTD